MISKSKISDSNKLKILFTEQTEAIFVEADKVRIYYFAEKDVIEIAEIFNSPSGKIQRFHSGYS